MPEPQARIWRQVVATKPVSWFTADSVPILTQFCRHVVTADQLQRAMEQLPEHAELADLERWLALRDRES
jgi:hypothetical protein